MEVQKPCKGSQDGEIKGEFAVVNVLQEGGSANCKDGRPSVGYQDCVLDSPGEGMQVLDFDILCATVAMQSEHLSFEFQRLSDREADGGVHRMWEGDLMDCCDDRNIFLRTTLYVSWPCFLSVFNGGTCIVPEFVFLKILFLAWFLFGPWGGVSILWVLSG
jgi:hypothetical protein